MGGVRTRWIVVGAVAFAATAGIFAHRTIAAQERARAARAWASLERCLYGGPLGDGEVPSQVLEAIDLCADPARPTTSPSCRSELEVLAWAWDGLADEDADMPYGPARAPLRVAMTNSADGYAWWGRSDPAIGAGVDELTHAVRTSGLVTERVEGRRYCAAEPAAPFDAKLALGYVSTPLAGRSEDVVGGALRLAWSSAACWFDPAGADVRCEVDHLASTPQLFEASSDTGELTLAVDRAGGIELRGAFGGGAFFRSRARLGRSGFTDAEGAVTTIDLDREAVVHVTRAGVATSHELPDREQVAWREVHKGWLLGLDEQHGTPGASASGPIYAIPLERDGAPRGAASRVGEMQMPIRIRGCAHRGGVTFAFASPDKRAHVAEGAEEARIDVAYATMNGERIGPLVRSEVVLPVGGLEQGFGCSPDGMPRWTFIRERVVHDVSCTAQGCTATRSEPIPEHTRVSALHASPLGTDRVLLAESLVVTRSPPQPFIYVVRARVARVGEIAAAPFRTIFAAEHVVPGSWIGPWTATRGEVGWLLAQHQGVLYGYRLEAGGSVVQLQPATSKR